MNPFLRSPADLLQNDQYGFRRIGCAHLITKCFLQRYELSLGISTTIFKQKDTKVTKGAHVFKSSDDTIDFSKYQLSNIITTYETVVFKN
ncbi:hypothetical protein AVEN_178573-1 [Araneus ventricosus]|uniref:Uncharacterized protein n=1 Tax=Araneus ventricosus TaxID=182803 RepID=A0A4Y2FHP2_ARAVE|nr:hypothetical protein AVEN_178573-1 [Araneus ventricosus]